MKCYKCKSKVSWADCDCVFGDGKHNSLNGKVYCNNCFFNKARKKEYRKTKNSIDLMELLRNCK